MKYISYVDCIVFPIVKSILITCIKTLVGYF